MGEMMTTRGGTVCSRPEPRLRRLMWVAVLASMLVLAGWAARADAAAVWRLDATSETLALAGGQFRFYVDVVNAGDVRTDGSTYTLTVTLPPGMRGVSANGFSCPGVAGATVVVCPTTFPLDPHEKRMLTLTVDVDGAASGILTARYDITGAGATPASTVDPVTVTSDPTPPLFGIEAFDARVDRDAAGTALTQAGAHPYSASVSFDVTTATDPTSFVGALRPIEPVKDIQVDLPPGFIGNPTAAAKCTVPELANMLVATVPAPLCAATAQVGTALIRFSGQGEASNTLGPLPVFNMVPPPDAPARFGFNAFGTIVVMDARLRSGSDYGVTVSVRNASEGLALIGSTVTLWGVPSDPSHDLERACPGEKNPWERGPSCRSGAPPATFLRNPTSCTDPTVGLTTTLSVDSWVSPGAFQEATTESHLPPGYPFAPIDWGAPRSTDGCENVPFDPRLDGQPLAGSKAGQPAGFAFDLTLPQEDTLIAESDLKKAVVTLPEGVRVNPSSADGLAGCSLAQIALTSAADAACPAASKLGDVTIETPLLKDPLSGGIYLATPFENPSRSLVALYIVASGSGINIKVAGSAQMDPNTGQITATFDNNPQAPFSRLHLEFKGGPRAPLTLPNRCGTFTTHAELTGWNGRPPVSSDSSFTVSESCNTGGFSPTLNAGVERSIAGVSSPFSLRLTREDTDQEFSTLDITTPEGLTAVLKGVPPCPQAAIDVAKGMVSPGQGALELATPACPAASKLGSVVVGAGAGTNPFYVQSGKAYLAGPYKGAPLSFVFVTPAVAGPFDLGNVVVQTAIHVNPVTAKITAKPDPLPTILQGIPLDLRDVRVDLDRSNFIINPTNCSPMSVDALVTSTQSAIANLSSYFQVSDCAALGFKPKLTLSLRGGTTRGKHPALTAILKPRPGDANISKVSVALPKSEFLDQAHLVNICTRAQFAASACPRASIYGHATVITPLFDEPLTGPVYLRSSSNLLPDLVPDLRGPAELPIRIESAGRVDEVNGGIRNTFDFVPDAPFTKFVLRLKGGNKGLLQNSRNICRQAFRATVKMGAHNGKIHNFKSELKANCGKSGKKAKHNGRG
jgi:hypothetical protein